MANKKISFEDGERIRYSHSNKESNKKSSSKKTSLSSNKKNRRKKAKRRNFIGWIITIIILAIIVGIVAFGINFVSARLKNLKIVEIDKTDLEVNENLLEELDGKVSAEEFDDIITVVLFGSDSRNTEDIMSGRADSIIVASLNPIKKSIKLLSIPRDTYVNIPGYGYDKINHAYAHGGPQLMIKTINSNFGLNITEYAMIDFLGLATIINEIGGIEMEITKAEMDVINQYLVEIYALEDKPYVPMTEYGKLVLTGEQAVAHCRNRYVGSDFTRAQRQRDVIMATVEKVSNLSVDDAMDAVDVSLAQITTNVDVTAYLGKITNVIINIMDYKDNIISAQVPATEYGYDKIINGIYYFGADLGKAKADFMTYIYEK